MSVVAIPFKNENDDVVLSNLSIAASHPRIDQVWAVGTSASISEGAKGISMQTRVPVEVVPDERLGQFRRGKGDAMNTALHKAATAGVDRLHFYDADITNFGSDWIEGAEQAADQGFGVVRHRFPRAATDAMITWMITKPMLAMRYPDSVLPTIGQPLGGELLLTKAAIETLAANPDVVARSDWGIDTALTFNSVASGFSLYEHNVADGKRHTLYGSLDELKEMLVECFDSANALPEIPIPRIGHYAEEESPVPSDLRSQAGYSVDTTTPLITSPPTSAELSRVDALPPDIAERVLEMIRTGTTSYFDAATWWRILQHQTEAFELGDPGSEDLLFRLWVARVLNYTNTEVKGGFERAMSYLESTIEIYRESASSTEQ